MYETTITLLLNVTIRLHVSTRLSHPRPILTFVLPDTVHTLGTHRVYICRIHPKVCTVSGNTNVNMGLRMPKSSRNM